MTPSDRRRIARALGAPVQRRESKNTALARRIAKHYENEIGRPFPGGPENAYIKRTNAGHWQRSEGA